jgi:hypothetical protein
MRNVVVHVKRKTMKKIWPLILFVLAIIALIFYTIELNRKTPDIIDEKIIISLIGSLTAIITVIGSIYVNKLLSNENSKRQRALEIRKTKQEYYHEFTESFLLRIAYLPNQKSKEFKDSDRKFCIEKNRLPLYASQEIIEYVDEVASGKSMTADFKTLFDLIRKDLLNDELKEFQDLKSLNVTLPSEETRKGTV